MPPKKDKGDGGENNESKIQMLDFRVKQLQMKIVDEQERADRAKASEKQLHSEMMLLDNDFKVQKDKLFTTSNEMNRQYKQCQDELLKSINELKATVIERDDVIKTKDQQISDLLKEYEQKIQKKDQDITDFKRKIEDMSNEFASMLRETLDKMQERIELAQWDDSDPQIMKRLKDISGMNQK